MYYPEELVEEIRERTDIVDLISQYVNLKKQGGNYFGLCPFHNEKTPSFTVNGTKQMYHCFGCGAGGNAYTFIMEYDSLSFVEAISVLADRAGVVLPDADESEESKRAADRKKRLLDIHTQAATYYYSVLVSAEGKTGYSYFSDRGLSKETIKKFGLGFTGKGNGLYRFLKSKGYQDDELKASGLISYDEKYGAKEKFWNRVMFPIMDINNHVIAFGGRVLGDALPKYMNSPETAIFDKSRNLYGLNYARRSNEKFFLLCEGYMDVISLHQAGFTSACASLGTALTGIQARLIKRYTDKVIITYDSDGAGVKAAIRAIPILKGAGVSVKVLNMQPYKDPDEFIKNLGSEEYRKRIEEAQGSFEFEITVLERDYDFSDPEQKTDFYNAMAKKLLSFEDELERNNYIEALALRYNIRIEDLKKLVAKQSAGMAGIRESINYTKKKERVKEDGLGQAQGLLLTWLSNEPALINRLSGWLGAEDFFEEPYNRVAGYVFGEYEESGTVSPARIINKFEEVNEQTIVAGLFDRHLPEEDFDKAEKEKVLNEIVKRIRKQNIDRLARTAEKPEELQKLMVMMAQLEKLHISL